MKFRSFGRTGWQVSEIAFGAWQIGGDWDDIDDKDSIDTLLYACGRGINFVDTAERRCHGNSSQVSNRLEMANSSCRGSHGFPFRHRAEAMQIGGERRAVRTGRNEEVANGGEG